MIFKGAYSDYFGFIYIDPIFTLTHRQVLGTKRKRPTNQKINRAFAVRTGLEPATSAVTGRHSNQLNYRTRFYCQALFSNAVQRYGNFSFWQ